MRALRDFLGSAELGWKVAWPDRMVYIYGGVWLAAMIFGVLPRQGRRIRPLCLLALRSAPPSHDPRRWHAPSQ